MRCRVSWIFRKRYTTYAVTYLEADIVSGRVEETSLVPKPFAPGANGFGTS
jgi:hypothetical protein